MFHRRAGHRLNQKPAHARSLERNLVTSLVLYEAIRTTRKRARVIQPIFDGLITAVKTKEPQLAIRYLNRVVTDRNASRKLMEVFKDRFSQRSSGYTRIVAVGSRKGDGAELVDLTLMDTEKVVAAPAKKEKTMKAAKTTKAPKKVPDSA